MFAFLSAPAPSLPYGYLWEILFATILAVSLVLAIKYQSFGKRWVVLLLAVGVAEYEFSLNTPPPYNILVVGTIIGLATAFSGLIIPALYFAKPHLHKKQIKSFFIFSGCLELIFGAVGFFYFPCFGIYSSYEPPIAQIIWSVVFGLFTIGVYSLIVGAAGFSFTKPKKQ